MKWPLRRPRLWFAATATTGGVVALLTAPPAARRLDGIPPLNQVTGGYHIHTSRSDGSGTVDEVAAAASRAGLAFMILTDHGDATRPPDPPAYKDGVLVIDAVEVNTTGGHLVALGLSDAAPYPLAGNPRDVIEDIHRLGGTAVVAHPDSPSAALSWRGPASGFDGIEWLNADSEWRDKSLPRLLLAAAHSVWRPSESVASLFERPAPSLTRWTEAAQTGHVFTLAGLDAHARLGWQTQREPRSRVGIERPSYEAMFGTMAQTVLLDAPLSGGAAEDAARVLDAIDHGRSFSIIRAFATPASLAFTAEQGATVAAMGDRLADMRMAVRFRASVPQAPDARVTLVCDGREIATGAGAFDFSASPGPRICHVEAWLVNPRVPWIVSNAIAIGPVAPLPASVDVPIAEWMASALDASGCHVEHDPSSAGDVRADGTALRFEFRLGPGRPEGQYAALVTDLDPPPGRPRIRLTARGSEPMRISVQLLQAGRRWRRSVYLDQSERPTVFPIEAFESVGGPPMAPPDLDRPGSLLFVVDTLNTRPGTTGVLWISGVAFSI